MDIIEIIKQAAKEASSFENHPAQDLTLEERVLYLQGLALVMNADGDIHPEEKEYIRIMIKSFEMDESILESFTDFSLRPDKDTIQLFFRTFRRRPISQLFLYDALMIASRDGSLDEREKTVIDMMAEYLMVIKEKYQNIYELFVYVHNERWQEAGYCLSYGQLNINLFKHLLIYNPINIDSVYNDLDGLKLIKLQQLVDTLTNIIIYKKLTIVKED